MEHYISLFVASVFVENLALAFFLGMCTFLAVSKKVSAAFGLGMTVMLATRLLVPSLHTVPENPLQDLVSSPLDALVFAAVLVVAGGIREEVQRAFLLTRFERALGGPTVGLVVTSVLFGAGHIIQGADAAVTTGLLGAFWAAVYLRRRSIGATVVSHAGFNLVQIVQFLLLRP